MPTAEQLAERIGMERVIRRAEEKQPAFGFALRLEFLSPSRDDECMEIGGDIWEQGTVRLRRDVA
jgi:hypothetical protein